MGNKYFYTKNELQLLLAITENQFIIAQEQLEYFKSNFTIDDIDDNIAFIVATKNNIFKLMTDSIICTRALRDKLENG